MKLINDAPGVRDIYGITAAGFLVTGIICAAQAAWGAVVFFLCLAGLFAGVWGWTRRKRN